MGSAIIPLIAAVIVAATTWQGHRRVLASGDRLTQGYYRGRGVALGLAGGLVLDAAITIVTGRALLGIAIGVPAGLLVGLLVGVWWEHRHRGELRPLNSEARETRRFAFFLALLAIVLAVVAVLGIVWFSR